MKRTYLTFSLLCLLPFTGCGQSASQPTEPSGNELQAYLAEHPEIANATEPESND